MKCGITNPNITKLSDNQIFVFGSNMGGRHGAGAARAAMSWGAVYGQGVGLQGKTYAIPTLDAMIQHQLSIHQIKNQVDSFVQFAKNNPNLHFLVTEIGCGLAGFTHSEIAPLFVECLSMSNVSLPLSFVKLLGGINQ